MAKDTDLGVIEVFAGGDTSGATSDVSIPDVEIESIPAEYQPKQVNYANDAELVKKALGLIQSHQRRFSADRKDYEDLWKDCDYMWKCAKNTSKRSTKTNKNDSNSESATHASTGSTLHWRQANRLAAETLSIYAQKDDPFRFEPISSEGAIYKADEGRIMAAQLNALSRWTRLADDFERKFIEGVHQLEKLGNVPCLFMWKRKMAKRIEKQPVRQPMMNGQGQGEIVKFEFPEVEKLVENFPSVLFGDIAHFWADRHIGNTQDQNCVLYDSLSNYADLYKQQRADEFLNVENIDASHLYTGERDQDSHQARQENLDMGAGDDTQTGLFQQWDVHVRLPISDDGNWDAKENEPKIFWATFIGDLHGDPVCVRLERNRDPDDEIPWLMWHQFPDDPDMLYHVASAQIIGSNYDELTTAKNQAIDNRTNNVRRPLKAVVGAVHSTDLKFGQNKVFWVESMDSLGEFNSVDITGTIMANIEYIEGDSNRALGTDRPIEGVAMGQRTSASEAVNVFEQAKIPHMINARYQLGQFFKWYGTKFQRYWPLYAHPSQVMEITGEDFQMQVVPADLYGDYEVVVDVVNDAQNEQLRNQSMDYAMERLLANPATAQFIEVPELLRAWFEMKKFRGVNKFIRNNQDFDAQRIARMENQLMTDRLNPQYTPPGQTDNHAAHLKEHKSYRIQFDNIENAYELWPGLSFLDQHIAETEFMVQSTTQRQIAPGPAPSGNQSPGEDVGNAMAGEMGAMAQAPGMA